MRLSKKVTGIEKLTWKIAKYVLRSINYDNFWNKEATVYASPKIFEQIIAYSECEL